MCSLKLVPLPELPYQAIAVMMSRNVSKHILRRVNSAVIETLPALEYLRNKYSSFQMRQQSINCIKLRETSSSLSIKQLRGLIILMLLLYCLGFCFFLIEYVHFHIN